MLRYIFQDLVTGGDLVSYIESRGGKLPEIDACMITYQLLKSLSYLHHQDIVHRDLKPENVLMSSIDAEARVILTDFGQAIKILGDTKGRSKRMKTYCGTLDWVAP